jgi:D-2-hydroxyglutarate dehydrogenase
MVGKVYAYDISYEVKEWANLIAELRKSINAEVMGYGHIGDGNIHVNMIVKEG